MGDTWYFAAMFLFVAINSIWIVGVVEAYYGWEKRR